MPFIELKTNVKIEENKKKDFVNELNEEIKLIGKTSNWLMINVIDNQDMYFNGSNKACAICEVKLYGEVDEKGASRLTKALTDSVNKNLGIDSNRIYINYFGTNNWGYSGFNF